MDLAQVERLLNQSIGLDAASVGPSALHHAVQERMRACGLGSLAAYWERLNESAAERQQLVESVVVPETWFFRDGEAFAALARLARGDWAGRAGLRLLSLPCSSGEEPYSMAMALLDAGVPAERLQIDAVDVSERALSRARGALYGRNSFRGQDLSYRERHFEALPQGYRPGAAVRAAVRFQQGNLFAPELLAGARYDAVFCRNVLIYFDRAAQARALGVLSRLLEPEGVLFVAPAETALLREPGFSALPWPRAFAFRKGGAAPRPLEPVRPRPPRPEPPRPRPAAAVPPAAIHVPVVPAAPDPAEAQRRAAAEIARLGDQGRLDEATRCAEEYLRVHGPAAQIFHLLGLMEDAAGNSAGAERHYRRALYLDPGHRGSLTHLALLLERSGEADAAQRMRGRIQRLERSHDG